MTIPASTAATDTGTATTPVSQSANQPIYTQLTKQFPVFAYFPTHRTLHASHRGARSHTYTENTVRSYHYAVLDCNTDILEIDICITQDNVIVLKHDDVFSMHGNHYNVQNLTLNQLNKLFNKQHTTMAGQVHTEGTDEPFVTLEQLLHIVHDTYDVQRQNKIVLFIDYKITKAVQPCVALLKQYNMLDRVIFGAVDHQINQAARQHKPANVPICADVESMRQITGHYKQHHDFDTYTFHHDIVGYFVEGAQRNVITTDLVTHFHKHNKPIFCVGEHCDDSAVQHELIQHGVDCLFVDNPKLLQQTLQTLSLHVPNRVQARDTSQREQSKHIFTAFLHKYNQQSNIDMSKIEVDEIKLFAAPDLADRAASEPKLSLFNSKDDTYLYGLLLTQALKQFKEPLTIVDNGCGSCSPTLMALLATKRTDVHVIAVDIDAEALEVSKHNATKYNVVSQYTFIESSMDTFLDNFKFEPNVHYLMSTNPPYIATPDLYKVDRFWLPIDGGIYGDKFLHLVIKRSYPPNVSLCIMWTSLSNPIEIINTFEANYNVVYNFSAIVPFGKYTSHPLLNPYLVDARNKGFVVFDGDQIEQMTHTIVGTLLTHKQ